MDAESNLAEVAVASNNGKYREERLSLISTLERVLFGLGFGSGPTRLSFDGSCSVIPKVWVKWGQQVTLFQ